jgi:hypothetical protein
MIEKKEKKILSEEEKEKFRKRGKAARSKGHRVEVELAKEFRELGYTHCATTRATSRQLDACAIDLNYIPANIQSKADKRNFNFKNYLALIDEVNSRILKLPTELQYRLTYPTIVFHTKDRECLCVLRKQDLYELIKQIPK